MKHSLSNADSEIQRAYQSIGRIFDDAEAWGVEYLKGWIDDYESSRFTAINSHTAVITSEYNMECLMEWLKRNTPHCRDNRMLNKLRCPHRQPKTKKSMIAKTILQQIGGRRFVAMTGSKDFIDMGNGLRMSLQGTRRARTALTSSTMQD